MHINRKGIKELIEEKDLITNYTDLDRQITPNGFDLTVKSVEKIVEKGSIDFTNEERVIPETKELETKDGWWDLGKGVYKITMNEIVDIPNNIVGYAYTRSSLLRMGCHIQNGFWEAGYNGETKCLLVVENPKGMRLKKGGRVLQLAFQEIDAVEEGYKGIYSSKKS